MSPSLKEWKPIETAPTNGERIMLAFTSGPEPHDWGMAIARHSGVGWVESNTDTNYGGPISYRPTHWRELA